MDKKAVGNLLAGSTEHRTAKLNVNTGGQEPIQFHGRLYQKAHALETLLQSLSNNQGFPGGSDGKASGCNVEDPDSIPRSGRSPGGGHGNPLQYSCPGESHGQRSLAGYSPWGHKESDMTELLHFHFLQ